MLGFTGREGLFDLEAASPTLAGTAGSGPGRHDGLARSVV